MKKTSLRVGLLLAMLSLVGFVGATAHADGGQSDDDDDNIVWGT